LSSNYHSGTYFFNIKVIAIHKNFIKENTVMQEGGMPAKLPRQKLQPGLYAKIAFLYPKIWFYMQIFFLSI